MMAQTALQQARANLAMAQARLDADGHSRAGRRHADRAQRRAGQRRAAREGIDGAGARRRDAGRSSQIDEKNLSQLKLGQKALGSADAYPQERFGAELVYINPGIDPLRGSVEVKLRVSRSRPTTCART